LSGCAEYCLRVVGLLWAVLGVPGAPSGRVWPVGSGGVASRGCIHTSKIVSQKVHPSLKENGPVWGAKTNERGMNSPKLSSVA